MSICSNAGLFFPSSVVATLAKFLGTSRVRTLNIEDIGLGPLGFQELEKGMPKELEVVRINIR